MIPWDVLITLIIREGLPLALKLAAKWGNKNPVTEAELLELANLVPTARQQMILALTRAGKLNTPEGIAMLALVPE